jgi:hypothetical protein
LSEKSSRLRRPADGLTQLDLPIPNKATSFPLPADVNAHPAAQLCPYTVQEGENECMVDEALQLLAFATFGINMLWAQERCSNVYVCTKYYVRFIHIYISIILNVVTESYTYPNTKTTAYSTGEAFCSSDSITFRGLCYLTNLSQVMAQYQQSMVLDDNTLVEADTTVIVGLLILWTIY